MTLLCISFKSEKLKRFKKVSGDLKTILKTDLANLRFLSFEKGEACQSILIMLRGKIGLSKTEAYSFIIRIQCMHVMWYTSVKKKKIKIKFDCESIACVC